ncbi:hypothetical protein F5B22DRAFT_598556 [Xylaria bambusicola]|uniref:uncharacterized protein n=1 Tax=Xylaria bambusicola TaxID=326684 RepID=UPI0020082DEF|nr:uncharacterized protein F5B22DRAFT_598556 [Xylaria bambusicola]KAI0520827.1 hypothetical protein F5B22DRAFT_598556 [Xylaria bambusicola]
MLLPRVMDGLGPFSLHASSITFSLSGAVRIEMATRPSGTSCLSAEPHEENIKDPLLHYLGCIEIYQRKEFLEEKIASDDELSDQKSLRIDTPVSQAIQTEGTIRSGQKIDGKWKQSIEKELQRISRLRHTLSNDQNDKVLVMEVEESYKEWRNSVTEQQLHDIREWRKTLKKENSVVEPVIEQATEYMLEDDISVPVIQFCGHKEPTQTRDGNFPNQKTTVHKLLCSEPNILHKQHSSSVNRIRYFHIPSNNMIWAEKAIARYYGDLKSDFTATQRQKQRPKDTSTGIILQDRFWQGQLHGEVNSLPHARYMSPMCETISSSINTPDRNPNNVVLFMPYLHWETSVRREQFADEIGKIVLRRAKGLITKESKAKRDRQLERQPITKMTLDERLNSLPLLGGQIEAMGDAVDEYIRASDQSSNESNVGPFQCANPLGRYLLAAARLYEGMATYRDKMLLREYLPLDAAIHPRRTLDQAFYWTLNSTKKRDRDQVVYRGTTVADRDFHHYDHENNVWPDHKGLGGRACETCRTNIRKLSRVVMVDQLWMWILDGKTLITCFPKRYGVNKQDWSGVHKSIRATLESLGSNQVRTVFELGLIVLDECTRTFFDRAKVLDRQPQVIDEFSKAIGNIMHKQTTAFQRLCNWTCEAGIIFRSKGYIDTSELHIPLLDINIEGDLEREIEDVVEELDIMLHITNTYKDIVKRYVEQAEHIIDRDGKLSQSFQRYLAEEDNPTKEEEDYRSFKLKADECQERVNSHIKDLESLRGSAKNAAEDVLHLLSMKQQQASVVQAWQAVRQSEETIKQGRSIMVFTLATIVFLPLSFLTSVFGMNNREFGDNNWGLRTQLTYIFGISAGVVFISLLFAFSARLRAVTWSFYSLATTKLMIKTGIYSYFVGHKNSEQIFAYTSAKIDKMKKKKKDEVLDSRIEEVEEVEKRETQRAARRRVTKNSGVDGTNEQPQNKASSSEMRIRDLLCGLEISFARHRNKKRDRNDGRTNDDIENGNLVDAEK